MKRTSLIGAITVLAVTLVALQYWNGTRPSEQPLPALARDLPQDVKAADRTFKLRVAERFPPGTAATEIRRELTSQAFGIAAAQGRQSATLKRTMYPCDIVWNVRWRERSGKATDISAVYGLVCP